MKKRTQASQIINDPIEETRNMNKLSIQTAVFISIALFLTGCAGGISRQARSQINYTGPFNSVQAQPETYSGKTVMWGGKIIETLAGNGVTEMVVLQLELNNQGYPMDNDKSQGRFLVRSTRFMDPAIYTEGTLITVVGRLGGSESRLIGEMTYIYPMITMIEMKKWAPGENPSPRFHFGVGIGARF
jgi:outer membrane lipoprotein